MSTQKNSQKMTILNYLPETERAKLIKLVERLAQQTSEKQKYQGLYQQINAKYEELKKKYEELEQHNLQLKAQMATSRMAINKAKQAYIASRSGKKGKASQQSESEDEEWETVGINAKDIQHKKTELFPDIKTHRPVSNDLTKLFAETTNKKKHGMSSSRGYDFQDNQLDSDEPLRDKKTVSDNHIRQRYSPRPQIPIPQEQTNKSLKKSKYESSRYFCGESSSIFQGSGSKKEQIMSLKKEIESLTQTMQKKQTNQLGLTEKMKRCEQIKNRYMKSQEKKRNQSKQRKNDEYDSESSNESENHKKPMKKSQGKLLRNPEPSLDNSSAQNQQMNHQRLVKDKTFKAKDMGSGRQNMENSKPSCSRIRLQHESKGTSQLECDQSLYDVIATLNAN